MALACAAPRVPVIGMSRRVPHGEHEARPLSGFIDLNRSITSPPAGPGEQSLVIAPIGTPERPRSGVPGSGT